MSIGLNFGKYPSICVKICDDDELTSDGLGGMEGKVSWEKLNENEK